MLALATAFTLGACGGGGSPADAGPDHGPEPGPPPAGRFVVAAGETLRVAAGTTLRGTNGIEIRGTLVSEPGEGDLRLVAESGDIVLAGRIIVLPTTSAHAADVAPSHGPRAWAMSTAKALRGLFRPLQAPRRESAPAGNSAVFEALQGDIVLEPETMIVAGDGEDAPEREIVSIAEDRLTPWRDQYEYRVARDGGNGGDITLRAPQGRVVFQPRGALNPAPFHLGNGGAGSDVTVGPRAGVAVITQGPHAGNWVRNLVVWAGWGGHSGWLNVDTLHVAGWEGIPRFYGSGSGGRGGHIVWQPNDPPVFPFHAHVRGGFGGNGAVGGGNGGDAHYGTGDAIDPSFPSDSTPWTAEGSATGGAAGDAFPSESAVQWSLSGPEDRYTGGRGGDAIAHGHRGLHGTAQHVDGKDGGRVRAVGGEGGTVAEHHNARGGDGGNATVISGDGGDGADRCGQGQGGRGGMPGGLEARGGRGGSVSDNFDFFTGWVGGRGGDGGSVVTAVAGRPGRGGRGEPPGANGPGLFDDPIFVDLFSGEGGRGGFTLSGTVANVVYQQVPEPEPCGAVADYCAARPAGGGWRFDASISVGMPETTFELRRGSEIAIAARRFSYTLSTAHQIGGLLIWNVPLGNAVLHTRHTVTSADDGRLLREQVVAYQGAVDLTATQWDPVGRGQFTLSFRDADCDFVMETGVAVPAQVTQENGNTYVDRNYGLGGVRLQTNRLSGSVVLPSAVTMVGCMNCGTGGQAANFGPEPGAPRPSLTVMWHIVPTWVPE